MRFIISVLILLCFCCSKEEPTKDPLLHVLNSKKIEIKRIMDSIDIHEVQIRYTEIVRKADSIIFKDHDFKINDSVYFYPASSVKFPVALLALEKLNMYLSH